MANIVHRDQMSSQAIQDLVNYYCCLNPTLLSNFRNFEEPYSVEDTEKLFKQLAAQDLSRIRFSAPLPDGKGGIVYSSGFGIGELKALLLTQVKVVDIINRVYEKYLKLIGIEISEMNKEFIKKTKDQSIFNINNLDYTTLNYEQIFGIFNNQSAIYNNICYFSAVVIEINISLSFSQMINTMHSLPTAICETYKKIPECYINMRSDEMLCIISEKAIEDKNAIVLLCNLVNKIKNISTLIHYFIQHLRSSDEGVQRAKRFKETLDELTNSLQAFINHNVQVNINLASLAQQLTSEFKLSGLNEASESILKAHIGMYKNYESGDSNLLKPLIKAISRIPDEWETPENTQTERFPLSFADIKENFPYFIPVLVKKLQGEVERFSELQHRKSMQYPLESNVAQHLSKARADLKRKAQEYNENNAGATW